VPALPVCLLDPLWEQFAALLPVRPVVAPSHPLGCHRRRIPERVVFDHVIAALVHGSGYERIATRACSDRTIRRRLHEWAAAGLAEQLHTLALQAYDRMIGLELTDLAVDGCITKKAASNARWSPTAPGFPCMWSVRAPIATMRPCCGRPSRASTASRACRQK